MIVCYAGVQDMAECGQ